MVCPCIVEIHSFSLLEIFLNNLSIHFILFAWYLFMKILVVGLIWLMSPFIIFTLFLSTFFHLQFILLTFQSFLLCPCIFISVLLCMCVCVIPMWVLFLFVSSLDSPATGLYSIMVKREGSETKVWSHLSERNSG